MSDIVICFDCGENFEDERTESESRLCDSCIARRQEREKPIKPLKRRTCLDQLITALGVLVAIFMM